MHNLHVRHIRWHISNLGYILAVFKCEVYGTKVSSILVNEKCIIIFSCQTFPRSGCGDQSSSFPPRKRPFAFGSLRFGLREVFADPQQTFSRQKPKSSSRQILHATEREPLLCKAPNMCIETRF